MKVQVKNYTFNKTAKTVTFTDYISIDLDSILLITNVTSNVIIYNFANHSLGGTVLNNVLTLTYNTSVMLDTDKLQIFYEDSTISLGTSSKQDTQILLANTLNDLIMMLGELNVRLNVLSGMANAGQPALRVTPISSISTAVTGTLTSVGTLTSFGTGIPASEMANDMNNIAATLGNINNVTT